MQALLATWEKANERREAALKLFMAQEEALMSLQVEGGVMQHQLKTMMEHVACCGDSGEEELAASCVIGRGHVSSRRDCNRRSPAYVQCGDAESVMAAMRGRKEKCRVLSHTFAYECAPSRKRPLEE